MQQPASSSTCYAIKDSLICISQLFSNLVIIYLLAYEDGTDCVPKRRHIKFRRRGITQKKTYNNKSLSKRYVFGITISLIMSHHLNLVTLPQSWTRVLKTKSYIFFRTRLYIREIYSYNIDRTELVREDEGKIALSLNRHKATTTFGWVESSELCKTVSQVDKFGMQECVITITGKPCLRQSLRKW